MQRRSIWCGAFTVEQNHSIFSLWPFKCISSNDTHTAATHELYKIFSLETFRENVFFCFFCVCMCDVGWTKSFIADTVWQKWRKIPARLSLQPPADRFSGGNRNTSAAAPKIVKRWWLWTPSALIPSPSWMVRGKLMELWVEIAGGFISNFFFFLCQTVWAWHTSESRRWSAPLPDRYWYSGLSVTQSRKCWLKNLLGSFADACWVRYPHPDVSLLIRRKTIHHP